MQGIELRENSFQHMKALHLSYNRIPPASIAQLGVMK